MSEERKREMKPVSGEGCSPCLERGKYLVFGEREIACVWREGEREVACVWREGSSLCLERGREVCNLCLERDSEREGSSLCLERRK